MTSLSTQTTIQDVLHQLRGERFWRNVVKEQVVPAQPAQYADPPGELSPEVVDCLRHTGVDRLYSHQAESVGASLRGENVVIVTPTASGKTLCYNLPVLERLQRNPEARALYLFPTKALSHDQYTNLHDWTESLGREIRVYTYDGDTPVAARASIRASGHIVVTNPDMLHSGILPHHTKWIKLFENLETVVIDEMHHYRGVFGSHLANVIRRLRRICRFYGSDPKFICCSATIANPKEMAERIVEAPFTLVNRSGAPRGERIFLFYNPPVVNRELGIRASSIKEASKLADLFIQRDLQTIVFARSRNHVEILTKYLKRMAARRGGDAEGIRAYRGGYLPNERRAIERGVRLGEIRGVVSTNALELGIDIGSLQVSILTGYPGSIASAWQQSGRAGRQTQTAITVMIGNSSPLDQFLMNQPDYFFGSSPENGVLNPDNVAILAGHLRCALHEIPLDDGEKFGSHAPTAILEHFEAQGLVRRSGGRAYWASDAYPAEEVSLRTATPQNFVIHETTQGNRILAEIDYDSAQELVHEQAIYLHQARTYYVDQLDWERRRAYVREINADYYTDAVAKSDLKVLTVDEEEVAGADAGASPLRSRCFGDVRVTTTVPKFKKIKFETHENVGFGDIALPQLELQTEAAWWSLRPELDESYRERGLSLSAGLKGMGWLVHKIAALFVMSDPADLRALPMVRSPHDGAPTLYLYDRVPGGIGLARRAFGMDQRIFRAALEVARSCPCADGCPGCTGPTLDAGEGAKAAAAELLSGMIA
jgi:DEAD/DEAH box helicase domain-containing protein